MGLKLLSMQCSFVYMVSKVMSFSMKYYGVEVRMVDVDTMSPD